MSAKLVLTVKDSSRMAKDYSMSMMDKMFHPLKHNKILNSKAKIGILIDDEEEKGNVNLIGSIIGVVEGNGIADTMATSRFAKSMAGVMFKTGDGYLDLNLKDGDIIKVQCQAGIGGKVSIKILK